jgi:hypothetical protein
MINLTMRHFAMAASRLGMIKSTWPGQTQWSVRTFTIYAPGAKGCHLNGRGAFRERSGTGHLAVAESTFAAERICDGASAGAMRQGSRTTRTPWGAAQGVLAIPTMRSSSYRS